MPDNIQIDVAVESDLDEVVGLLRELADTVEEQGGIDVGIATENLAALLGDSNSHLLVARNGGEVVGFINFTVRRTALHAGLCGLIDELVVRANLRGSGVGRSLILAAADICRRLGCGELEVSTEKTNAAARRFYRQCGFDEDAVLLEMEL
ncbi:MAG TPA: GNAT family N-acetyltransferase [Dehalococcoidia bacterium]|nr:GNAT family N-acetyltransferase [Dehalococcoidia bacterium]